MPDFFNLRITKNCHFHASKNGSKNVTLMVINSISLQNLLILLDQQIQKNMASTAQLIVGDSVLRYFLHYCDLYLHVTALKLRYRLYRFHLPMQNFIFLPVSISPCQQPNLSHLPFMRSKLVHIKECFKSITVQ